METSPSDRMATRERVARRRELARYIHHWFLALTYRQLHPEIRGHARIYRGNRRRISWIQFQDVPLKRGSPVHFGKRNDAIYNPGAAPSRGRPRPARAAFAVVRAHWVILGPTSRRSEEDPIMGRSGRCHCGRSSGNGVSPPRMQSENTFRCLWRSCLMPLVSTSMRIPLKEIGDSGGKPTIRSL